MKLSEGVEWGIHCAMLLGALAPGETLSGRAMSEFHGVPESYLLKHLKALVAAGLLESVTGPRGGYRLAKPPDEISLLDVVQSIDGPGPAFRCTEIRRRGPCALENSAYPRPCGVNAAMLRAEQAYRAALAEETLAKVTADFAARADPRIFALAVPWLNDNKRSPKQ